MGSPTNASPWWRWSTGPEGKSPNDRKRRFKAFAKALQDNLAGELAAMSGVTFATEDWCEEKQSGRMCTIEEQGVGGGAALFEGGGISFGEGIDCVPAIISNKHPSLTGKLMYSARVSVVLHPANPHCPTVYYSARYCEVGALDSDDVEENNVWWFRGAEELTPYVLHTSDCVEFHMALKRTLDAIHPGLYMPLKHNADEQFRNPHRNETRGIGGVYFDYLTGEASLPDVPEMTWTQCFDLVQKLGAAFLPTFAAIIARRKDTPVTDDEREWQLIRRGRFVEFDLVHDPATHVGLATHERAESILMTLPPLAKWRHVRKPRTDAQTRLCEVLTQPRDWVHAVNDVVEADSDEGSSKRRRVTPAKSAATARFRWTVGERGHSPNERKRLFKEYVRGVQDNITSTLAALDGKETFLNDEWLKEAGNGGGRTRVMRDGAIFESGGCNWSEVTGANLPPSILAKHPHLKGKKFYATGVSMVIHPRNPHCPTVHLNYRYFEAGNLDSDDMEEDNVWWFGGGMDLTPWILYDDDAKLFHQHIKDACDKFSPQMYQPLKEYADDYFVNTHRGATKRGECRGIGGFFYDYMTGEEKLLYQGTKPDIIKAHEAAGYMCPSMTWTQCFEFSQANAAAFLPAYTAIIKRRMNTPYTDDERKWQLTRRGRYVEFNLVHDRGTLFGLQIRGRTESILMSLPPLVRWGYMIKPETDAQKKLIDALENPKTWLEVPPPPRKASAAAAHCDPHAQTVAA